MFYKVGVEKCLEKFDEILRLGNVGEILNQLSANTATQLCQWNVSSFDHVIETIYFILFLIFPK